jgi:protein-L-isoaspartate(D-aspartate) O-methyltransferase
MGTISQDNENDETRDLRQAMVDRLKNLGVIQTEPVEEAFQAIPRHLFVPEVEVQKAYTDIYIVTREQNGQAISSSSAPSIMAIMLEMFDLQPGQRILEIGAGTGYNAALMAHIVGETGRVVTIDIDEDIVQDARAHLQTAGIENVEAICADGSLGWVEGAPYDRVILTVSAADVAPAWREQLNPGGRLVLPFQLTSFQSKFAALPFMPDQFLLSFERTGVGFEGLDLRPCGFIGVRGDLALGMSKTNVAMPEADLSALLSSEIEASHIFQVLRGPAQDEETGVHLSLKEATGLRFWLILREPRFCEIYVQAGTDAGAVPTPLRRDATLATAFGLCEQQTCCLLMLQEEESGRPVDPERPFKLVIRRFGEDRVLAEQLCEQVIAWDRAGHPFVWSLDGRMKGLRVRAWPVETLYKPHPYECVLTRRHTHFIFTPSAIVVDVRQK